MASAWPSQQEVDNYVRSRAPVYGVQPSVAVAIRRGESQSGYVGDQGLSYGPFQLRFAGILNGRKLGPGLAEQFMKDTGLNPRDPSTWKAQVDWSLNHASHNGWGAWSAAKKLGYGIWDGITKAVDDPYEGLPSYGEAGTNLAGDIYNGLNAYVQNRAASIVLLGVGIFLVMIGLLKMASGSETVRTVVKTAGAAMLPEVAGPLVMAA